MSEVRQPVDPADGRRFARMWLRVELRSVPSRHFLRPSTVLIVSAAALFTVLLLPTLRQPLSMPAALAVALLLGLLLAAAVYSLSALRVEARSFAAAPHRWLLSTDDGWAGAYARPDRHSRMSLYSVWASPRGQHLGSALLWQVCADMDAQRCELQLLAVNDDAVRFYRRFGFEPVRRGRFRYRMARPPATTPTVG